MNAILKERRSRLWKYPVALATGFIIGSTVLWTVGHTIILIIL